SRFDIEGMEWLKDVIFAEGRLEKVVTLTEMAQDMGMSMVDLALCWCAANPNVSTVILGASKVSQLEQNLKSLDHLSKLTPEVMTKIDEILGNKPTRMEF
ncbi:MAG: aldo/keto reductase, partial [Bacteroidota bacterium]